VVSVPVPVPNAAAVVALVLRASRLGEARLGELSAQRASELVGEATYYRCTGTNEANEVERRLELDDRPRPDSEQDVYVRLEVEPGSDLINKEKYGLQKGLGHVPPKRSVRMSEARVLNRAPADVLGRFHMS
jgi:hypothetical protein